MPMNDIQLSTSSMDLFDRLRCSHRFVCPDSACALQGFISGFSMARGFSASEFSDNARRFVRELFDAADEKPWYEVISDNAVVPRSEIPLVYAASDFCRKIVYPSAVSAMTTSSARELFYAEQTRISGTNGLPPPHKLVLTEGIFGCWYLFFLNESGDRYYEVGMDSGEKLKIWVRRVLGVEPAQWGPEAPGAFASRRGA